MQRDYWTFIAPDGYRNLADQARALEQRGLAGVAVPQVYGSPFVPLAAAATATQKLQLASGIAIGLTRSPFENAMTAIDLDHISGRSFHLWARDWATPLDQRLFRHAVRQAGVPFT